mmetsp:Transcript_14919/g.51217  ORF Transcript_14919/g.51217 Transcript_14919/m.51217 type:complete len:271 (+) Transcript_14919:34-846(+)
MGKLEIGKAISDLFGGYNYDTKVSVEGKAESGVTISATGVKKGDAVNGDLKGSYTVCKGFSVEGAVNQAGKLSAKAEVKELAPGMPLKATLTGNLPDISSGKLALFYEQKALNLKCDMGISAAPKIDLGAIVKVGAVIFGGDVSYDSARGAVTKYPLGATYAMNDVTLTGKVEDKLDTIKVSYVQTVSPTFTVGAEIARMLTPKTTAFKLGAEMKLEGSSKVKGCLDSKGIVGLQYKTPINDKTSLTVCASFDSKKLDQSAKVGIQLAYK